MMECRCDALCLPHKWLTFMLHRPCYRGNANFLFPSPFSSYFFPQYLWTRPFQCAYTVTQGSQQVNMRRRPPSRGTSSIRRALAPVRPVSGAISDSLTLFLDTFADGAVHCEPGAGSRESAKDSEEVRRRSLQGAIDQVTENFEQAQQEYQGVAGNSPDWHKWKGEMIAYVNVVALLEDQKSRAVLVR